MFEIGSPGFDVLLGPPVANGDSESVVSSGRLPPQEALTATTVTSGNVGRLCVLGGVLLSSFLARWPLVCPFRRFRDETDHAPMA